HSLLGNIGIQQPIVFIRLADMIVRFVSQTFSLLKEILSALIQRYIKKILAQARQGSQGIKFLFAKSSKLILLSSVHTNYFRNKINITAKSIFCTALDIENKEVAIAPFNLLARFSSPYLEARGIQTAH
nr:hypothetical protein [Xenococcaceae cyanobacterium MO_167.B27]